jgi:hypothetical protein
LADFHQQKLGIAGVSSNVAARRGKESKPGAQIDLIIDRADGVVNLCEMKYANHPYTVSREDAASFQNKASTFASETATRKALHLTMVTSYGLSMKGYRQVADVDVDGVAWGVAGIEGQEAHEEQGRTVSQQAPGSAPGFILGHNSSGVDATCGSMLH